MITTTYKPTTILTRRRPVARFSVLRGAAGLIEVTRPVWGGMKKRIDKALIRREVMQALSHSSPASLGEIQSLMKASITSAELQGVILGLMSDDLIVQRLSVICPVTKRHDSAYWVPEVWALGPGAGGSGSGDGHLQQRVGGVWGLCGV
ncbi:MAG: hypothetical protein HQL52_19935, partial [Magnetococcales bacterium]|nr:hypothetical protein [Magnetococcales bacterium]